MKISLCMIVKDEAEVLARCLESARPLADEIVIVDTGSTDGTREIAESYADVLRDFVWRDDFAAARNYAFSLASGDYLMWLDADDVLPQAESGQIAALRELLVRESPDMVFCPYEAGGLVYYRERFLRHGVGFSWVGRVHECIVPRGKIIKCGLRVVHLPPPKPYSARNLEIYRKWEREEKLSGRDLFYYGRELYYHGHTQEAARKLEEMLAGEGWYVNKIEACKVLAECYLREDRPQRAREALLLSFVYGAPRASVLCRLGSLDMEKGDLRGAVFWYRAALLAEDHAPEGDFELPACRSLTPLLQLVVCHWRLGERAEALACHKKTEELAPAHPSVVYNHKFFAAQTSSDSASP